MRRIFVALLVVACGKADTPAAVPAPPPTPAAPAPPPADAAPSKIKTARCTEPCLFLVDTPFDKLLDTYKAECGKDTRDPGFYDCRHLDYMRNCIYAAHGLVAKKARWKELEKKPWYEPHPEFDAKSISELEHANVHELYSRGKACKKELHISGADYDHLKAYFAAMPAQVPKLAVVEGEIVSPEAYAKFLADHGVKKKLGKDLSAEYWDLPYNTPKQLRDLVDNDEHSRTLAVVYNGPVPVSMFFVYDGKNQLAGVSVEEFVEEGD